MPDTPKYVEFVRLSSQAFANLQTINLDAIYFIKDKNQIYMGGVFYGGPLWEGNPEE